MKKIMMGNFKEVFAPTPEQKRKRKEMYESIKNQAYAEKWCCTCQNYIPVDESLPGFITAFPECKRGGSATETCESYKSNNEV